MALVVVAAHRDRALLDQAHHRVDGPFGIAAIADEIAEQDQPLRPARAGRFQACGKGLPVGMDVGKDSQQHAFLHPSGYRRRERRC